MAVSRDFTPARLARPTAQKYLAKRSRNSCFRNRRAASRAIWIIERSAPFPIFRSSFPKISMKKDRQNRTPCQHDENTSKNYNEDFHSTALFELLQKSHVVFEQISDVIDLVHQCSHSIETEPERESGIDRRIDIHRAQNIRMHHP